MFNLDVDNDIFPSSKGAPTKEIYETLNYLALKHNDGDLSKLREAYKINESSYFSALDEGQVRKFLDTINEKEIWIFYIRDSNNLNRLPLETTKIEGWQRLNEAPYPVEQFLQKHEKKKGISPCAIFVNAKNKKIALFLNSEVDWEIWHEIRSVMFRICNWYYPDGKLDKEDLAYFKAVSERDSTKEKEIINELVDKKGLYAYYLKIKFDKWNNCVYDNQIKLSLSVMNEKMDNIRGHEREISRAQESYEKYKTIYESLISTRPDDDDLMYEFLINRRSYIFPHHIVESRFNYDIVTTLEFYDLEAFERLYANTKSSLYYNGEKIARIMKGVFKDKLGVFQIECEFEVGELTTILPYTRSRYHHENTIFHPHINGHACLGGNSQYIKEYLLNGEWGQAIDQTVAAAKNINFGDATVIATFTDYIRSATNRAFIKTNDGYITPNQLLKIMDEKENEDNG